jgi:hypothetical protein
VSGALLAREMDPEQLQRVRSGGHFVRRFEGHGNYGVQVDIYRTGHAYGVWSFTQSADGRLVVVEHALPTSYGTDGHFGTHRFLKDWAVPMDVWQRDAIDFMEHYVGRTIAREVEQLFCPQG